MTPFPEWLLDSEGATGADQPVTSSVILYAKYAYEASGNTSSTRDVRSRAFL